MVEKIFQHYLEFYTRTKMDGQPYFLQLWRLCVASRKYLLKYKKFKDTCTIYNSIKSMFSVFCERNYSQSKLNYPDIRPSHVQLREPKYQIMYQRFHQLDKPTRPNLAQACYIKLSLKQILKLSFTS